MRSHAFGRPTATNRGVVSVDYDCSTRGELDKPSESFDIHCPAMAAPDDNGRLNYTDKLCKQRQALADGDTTSCKGCGRLI